MVVEMRQMIMGRRSFVFHRNATFLSLLIGYAGYYLCRQNLSVAFIPMNQSLGLTTAQFGWLSSFGTLAYTIGKVTTGSVADSPSGGKKLFLLGMVGAVAASLIFSLGTGIAFFLGVWALNRFFQSMGWGGLVNVMSRWFSHDSYGTAMGFMSISYQFGGVIASLFAGFLLSVGFGWKGLFVVPALALAGIAVVTWVTMENHPHDVGHSLPHADDPESVSGELATETVSDTVTETELSYFSRFKTLLSNKMFLMMAALSLVLTFLRECFNVWMPAYFSQLGASSSAAAFKSAIFPLLGCAGTLLSGWFSDRYLKGRRAPMMCALMAGLVLALVALSQNNSIASSLGKNPQTTAAVLVGFVGFFLLGAYSFVGGVVALDFGGRNTSGTAAGLLDGAGYLGATLSGIGIAELVLHRGWNVTFAFMAGLTVLGIALTFTLWHVRPVQS
jgi:sugar phosphate permease